MIDPENENSGIAAAVVSTASCQFETKTPLESGVIRFHRTMLLVLVLLQTVLVLPEQLVELERLQLPGQPELVLTQSLELRHHIRLKHNQCCFHMSCNRWRCFHMSCNHRRLEHNKVCNC
jgi:hypothetical protein